MNKPKAILFDLDGTLIDSERFHMECWNEILREHGNQLTYADWLKSYSGIPLPTNAKNIIEQFNLPYESGELISRRETLTLERLKTTKVALMPYAEDILEFFTEKGLILALVTGSPRYDVDATFEHNNLKKYFRVIVTRSDVTNSKPDPESYNLCVDRLGLSKENCIVFEDTVNGIRSAKAAGLMCYAIQSNLDEHHKLSIADNLFLDFNAAKLFMLENDLID
ncbi:HAD family hydrolase [Hufsiella arboris]|nr:HAD family phosphatase [Hufsiella arboris]